MKKPAQLYDIAADLEKAATSPLVKPKKGAGGATVPLTIRVPIAVFEHYNAKAAERRAATGQREPSTQQVMIEKLAEDVQ